MQREEKAVAVGYSGKGEAPKILAVARGMLVGRLLEIAEEHDITIYRNSDLAEVLAALEVGSEIPEELFNAVAEVLAYCYAVNERFKEKIEQLDT